MKELFKQIIANFKLKVLNTVSYWASGEKLDSAYFCKKLFITIHTGYPEDFEIIDLSRYEKYRVVAYEIYFKEKTPEGAQLSVDGVIVEDGQPAILENILLTRIHTKKNGDYWTWGEIE